MHRVWQLSFLRSKSLHLVCESVGPNSSETMTREELKDLFGRMFTALPDLHDEVHQMVAEGDFVTCRITRTGTFTGKFGDTEFTGERFHRSGFHMLRIEDTRIAECWYVMRGPETDS